MTQHWPDRVNDKSINCPEHLEPSGSPYYRALLFNLQYGSISLLSWLMWTLFSVGVCCISFGGFMLWFNLSSHCSEFNFMLLRSICLAHEGNSEVFFGLFSQPMDSRVCFNTILSFSLQVSHHVIAVHYCVQHGAVSHSSLHFIYLCFILNEWSKSSKTVAGLVKAAALNSCLEELCQHKWASPIPTATCIAYISM